MKKLVISIFCIILMMYMLFIPQVKAEPNATANITFSGTSTANTVEININAGAFEGFEPGGVVNASLTLDYNSEIVSSIEAESYQDWKVDIQEQTKRVLISTDSAKDNIQIAKIIFHLNTENLGTESQTFSIKEFEIASGSSLNETYPQYDYTFTPTSENPGTGEDEEKNEIPENGIESGNSTNEAGTNGTTNRVQGNKTDTTVANTKLPAAGLSTIIIIAIMTIVVLAIIFKIKSRKIKY